MSASSQAGLNAQDQIKQLLAESVEGLKTDGIVPSDYEPKIELSRPPQTDHGAFAANLALSMAGAAKMSPIKLAGAIVERIPLSNLVSKAEVAGPGFINFFLSNEWLHATIGQIAAQGSEYGCSARGAGVKVQIEFVSANPTGPLHVGSGRNAAYGDALARLLQAAGYRVHREFYVNDAGNQIQRFTDSLQARYLQALGHDASLPEDGYKGEYLQALGKDLAADHAETLIAKPDEIRRIGLDKVMESHGQTLERFGITFDNWFSEQTLHDSGKVGRALDRLEAAGLLYEAEGAKWFKATQLGAPRDQVVVRSGPSEAPTYLGVDAAYLIDKAERGFERVIYVWGADHHGNVAGLMAVAKALGLEDRVEVRLHQMVNFVADGAAVRMSRRAGNIVTLDELIDEVGVDSAKFTFLSRSIDMTIDFDLEMAKSESPENPVYYVQYQHARAWSVLKQAAEPVAPDAANLRLLDHESELELLRKLSDYPQVVQGAAEARSPHRLTHYLQSLASMFSAFYRDCRVLSDDTALTAARLCLVDATRQVLANCLGLIGVGAPAQM